MKTLFFLSFLISLPSLAFKEVHCPGPGRDMMVADPAIVEQRNHILIMGTGDVLKYRSLEALTKGVAPQKERLSLFKEVTFGEGKAVFPMAPQELPWDLQFYEISGRKYLYGGVMSPLPGMTEARWPDENISRRIKVATYSQKLKGWVFQEAPVFGKVDHDDDKGHSYGQQIVEHKNGLYMFHEEISREGITELFVRKMSSPFKAGPARKVVGIEDLPLHLTKRVHGGHLLEGPRYTKVEVGGREVHLIFFSTGDFPTKNYATRVAYSLRGLEGPYKVLKKDLTEVVERLGLHGVGRAFPFNYKDKNWIIFHGAKDIRGRNHNKWPANLDDFKRCLFISEIELTLDNKGLDVTLK